LELKRLDGNGIGGHGQGNAPARQSSFNFARSFTFGPATAQAT